MNAMHKAIKWLKVKLESIDKVLERRAELKVQPKLPSSMTAEEALNFVYHRYFGDEAVIDTGPAVQAYPRMAEKICWYADGKPRWS